MFTVTKSSFPPSDEAEHDASITHRLIGAYRYDTCIHLCPYSPCRRCHGVVWGQPLTDPSPDTIPHMCSQFPVWEASCPPPFKFTQEPLFSLNITLTIIAIHRAQSPSCLIFLVRLGGLHSELIRLLFLQDHRETASGVQLAQPNRGLFHFHCTVFSTTLKGIVGSTLTKTVVLRVNLNIDGAPITSKTHTHP